MSERKAKLGDEADNTTAAFECINDNQNNSNDSNKPANESEASANQHAISFKSKLNISKKFLLKKEKCICDEGTNSNLNLQLAQQATSKNENQEISSFESEKKDSSIEIESGTKQVPTQQPNVLAQNKLRKNSSTTNNQVILSKDFSNRATSRSSLVPGLSSNSGAPNSGAYHHPMRRESFLYKSDNIEFDNKNRSASIGSE